MASGQRLQGGSADAPAGQASGLPPAAELFPAAPKPLHCKAPLGSDQKVRSCRDRDRELWPSVACFHLSLLT